MPDNESEIKLRSPIVQVILQKNPPFLVSWAMSVLFVIVLLSVVMCAIIKIDSAYSGSVHELDLLQKKPVNGSILPLCLSKSVGIGLKKGTVIKINSQESNKDIGLGIINAKGF